MARERIKEDGIKMNMDWLTNLDLNAFFDAALNVLFLIVKIPLKIWNIFPDWFHWLVYILIFLLALLMLKLLKKHRNLWRYY